MTQSQANIRSGNVLTWDKVQVVAQAWSWNKVIQNDVIKIMQDDWIVHFFSSVILNDVVRPQKVYLKWRQPEELRRRGI